MREEDFAVFTSELSKLALRYRDSVLSPAAQAVYWAALCGYSVETVKQAMANAEKATPGFFPSAAQIVEQASAARVKEMRDSEDRERLEVARLRGVELEAAKALPPYRLPPNPDASVSDWEHLADYLSKHPPRTGEQIGAISAIVDRMTKKLGG